MTPVYVGVLHAQLLIQGARSRKDRRQVVWSLRDRVRQRWEVTFHLLDDDDHPGHQQVVLTTAGNDPRWLRTILDEVRAFLGASPTCWPGAVDVEVFRWHPPEGSWAPGYDEVSDG